MVKFYKDARGGVWSEKDIRRVYIAFRDIMSFEGYGNFIENIENSTRWEVKGFDSEPSVVEYLKLDMTIQAIKRYRDINHCTLLEAKEEVYKMKERMGI